MHPEYTQSSSPWQRTKGTETVKAQQEALLTSAGAEMWEGGCSEHKGLSRETELP